MSTDDDDYSAHNFAESNENSCIGRDLSEGRAQYHSYCSVGRAPDSQNDLMPARRAVKAGGLLKSGPLPDCGPNFPFDDLLPFPEPFLRDFFPLP